jgi:GH15 family glucan-1,4-alpha-glucosidase
MVDLYRRSIEIIKGNQSPSGAYVASPNFNSYAYCWFRDGAFTAYSMDLVGEHQSSRRFHAWTSQVIGRHSQVIERAVRDAQHGEGPPINDFLHTRYTLDGEEGNEDWPNYQLDGIGTWLWSLREHRRLAEDHIPDDWLESAGLAVEYLSALWPFPCSDCWEEFPEQIHTYTLASIYAGIQAFSDLTGHDNRSLLENIRMTIIGDGIQDGHFVKYVGSEEIDTNLIALATPYDVVKPDDPRMCTTIDRIEVRLRQGGGLHRYPGDSYYGGGEWILLTAWLGWYWTERGEGERARQLLDWIEAQADEEGDLPEQVSINLNNPPYYDVWRARWGEIAQPLLWSHAKYIILHEALARMG